MVVDEVGFGRRYSRKELMTLKWLVDGRGLVFGDYLSITSWGIKGRLTESWRRWGVIVAFVRDWQTESQRYPYGYCGGRTFSEMLNELSRSQLQLSRLDTLLTSDAMSVEDDGEAVRW